MSQVFRSFVAIDVPALIRTRLSQFAERNRNLTQYRWVESDSLHVTLNFIGDVTQQDVSSLCRRIESTVQAIPPFRVSLKGIGVFPKAERPRVIWAGVESGTQEMLAVYSRVAELLESLQYDRDRHEFRPHVTLARLKRNVPAESDVSAVLAKNLNVDFGEFEAKQVVIYESVLEKSGPRYTPMARIKLAGK